LSTPETVRKDDGEAMWAPHRRPTFPVNAPVFTRHLVIRVDDDMAPYLAEDFGKYKQARQKLIAAVNGFIFQLQPGTASYRPCFVAKLSEADAERKSGFSPIELTDTLFFRINVAHSLVLGVRVDVHNEYLTVTLIADTLSKPDPFQEDGTPPKNNNEPLPLKVVGEIIDVLTELSGGDLSEKTKQCRDEWRRKVALLYDRLWDDLSTALKRAGRTLEPAFGIQLCDVRGFVVCAPNPVEPMNQRHLKNLELRSSRLQDRLDRKIDYDVFSFIKRRPNFFSTLLGFENWDPGELNSPANVPISGVLDGAAIYGSTLRPASVHEFRPLQYFVVYNDNSRSQLGRLLRRLHVLAELRIAALMDMKGLRTANRQIRELGREVDRIAAGETGVTLEAVHVLSAALADIDQGISETGTAPNGEPGGTVRPKGKSKDACRPSATYRIERSRYYAKSYIERIQDLRIVRIEGWQPYDAFMRRNLFMEFDYVSQIGDRFATVGRRIERLGALVQIGTLQTHNASINKNTMVTAEHAKVVGKQVAELQYVGNELLKLQAIAEPVGTGAFAYYIGNSLSKLLAGCYFLVMWRLGEGRTPAELPGSLRDGIEAICILLAGLVYHYWLGPAVWRGLRRRFEIPATKD
jgi:hypothetical protein